MRPQNQTVKKGSNITVKAIIDCYTEPNVYIQSLNYDQFLMITDNKSESEVYVERFYPTGFHSPISAKPYIYEIPIQLNQSMVLHFYAYVSNYFKKYETIFLTALGKWLFNIF